MKNFLRKYWLHISCVAVWTAIVILCYSAYKIYNTDKLYQQVATPQTIVMIEINAPVTIIAEEPKEKIMSEEDITKIIYNATRTWDSHNIFQYADAINLYNLITAAADKHGLPQKAGFVIVHIESDFKKTAKSNYNAKGLCQVTETCLNEYNNNHEVKYTMQDMFDPEKNLEVGFWYYARILNHYDKCYRYITRTDLQTELRDAYIAYNYGVTRFSRVGSWGRNELIEGRYPENIYGSKTGDTYTPVLRFNDISQNYF